MKHAYFARYLGIISTLIVIMIASTGFLGNFGNSSMDTGRLEKEIQSFAENVERDGNAMRFTVNDVVLYCFTDENHDRMRFITEIAEASELTDAQKDAMLNANFHSALDARYAVSNGFVYGAFIHPLSPLTSQQIQSGAYQVANLSLTFGSEYASGGLSFGAQ
ncbi:MAG: hypothetical protein AAFX93_05010 [Verrucomicrobiota bacterium]